ncbi:MAG: aspartate dehydrogenase [Blautia sp.]|nr:aspartate dehydrogenase [Blautia sp.]
MFGKKKKKTEKIEYDRSEWQPVLKCSICNGEQVGGLRNKSTGEFREIMFVRGQDDLERFREIMDERDIAKIY